jgi:hypothetical protein
LQALDQFGRILLPLMRQIQVNAAPAVAGHLAAKPAAAERGVLLARSRAVT